MRTSSWARSVACAAGALASLTLVLVAPAWVGLAAAVTAACGWCFFLETEERTETRGTIALVEERVTDGETVYVFGRTYTGTRRAIERVRQLAGDRPIKLVVFVIHQAHPGAPVNGSTVMALRRDTELMAPVPRVVACACRRPDDVTPWLAPMSAVVIERARPAWWPTFSRRLATALRRAGCRVALA